MTQLEARLDRISFAAWPAEEVHDLEGWRLRFMRGVSRRGNSVWPGEARGGRSLVERVEAVERWYGERDLPAVFQVSPESVPSGLDAFLAERGYRTEAAVSVQVAESAAVASGGDAGACVESGGQGAGGDPPAERPRSASANAAEWTVRVELGLPPEWFAVSAFRGRFGSVADTYRGLLDRIGDRACYAMALRDGSVQSVALGVTDAGWMGVFSMLTVPEARRSGAARAVLAGLARDALASNVRRMYLLVERDNLPAQALYRSASFEELYGYHYRVAPELTGP